MQPELGFCRSTVHLASFDIGDAHIFREHCVSAIAADRRLLTGSEDRVGVDRSTRSLVGAVSVRVGLRGLV